MPSAVRMRADGAGAPTGTSVPASKLSDEALLSGYGASDADAAAEFVRRFQRRVFGLAFTVLGDARVAEDVAQEALARAWRHAAVFDARRGSVATWLLTITRNLAIDAGRLGRAVAIDPETLLGLMPVAPGRDPADVASLHDDVERLRGALRTLPDEQRRAVVLAGIWGLSARRDRRAGRDPPRDREDADPHRAPSTTSCARRRASRVKPSTERADARAVGHART